jgi:hypothetical protein
MKSVKSMSAAFATLALTLPALGQTPQPVAKPAPQLSPKAAYDEAMHPLELTRRSFSNWSETEMGALTVSIGRAAKECGARDAKSFTGDALIDYAQLCALGQAWPAVVDAAKLYIAEDAPAKPQLGQAYAYLIHAELNLKDEPSAYAHSRTMLATQPYNTVTAETIGLAMEYMQFVYTADAVALGALREPYVVAKIVETATPAKPDAVPAKPDTAKETGQSQPLHELYAAGLAFAALQQLGKSPEAEIAQTIADLDAALPATLAPDEALPIAASRRRYALLGKPLPKIVTSAYLSPPGILPQLPSNNAITALLLFPDWCAQCVRMGSQFPETVFLVTRQESYLYGLLAETVPPNPPHASDAKVPFAPADASLLLRETPTFVVAPATLAQFEANDFPFFILTDTQGIVRVLQPVNEDALTPGGAIDSAIARVVAQWPNPRHVHQPAGTTPAPDAAASPNSPAFRR